jgi:hypothetical protein
MLCRQSSVYYLVPRLQLWDVPTLLALLYDSAHRHAAKLRDEAMDDLGQIVDSLTGALRVSAIHQHLVSFRSVTALAV